MHNNADMSQFQSIEFSIDGIIAGKKISASNGLPLNQFVDFNSQVLQFLQGSENKAELRGVEVQIEDGSYLLRALIPAGILSSVSIDTEMLSNTNNLKGIDPKRAQIILEWQDRAKMSDTFCYKIRRAEKNLITISNNSKYSQQVVERVIDVERYIVGTITDWGGAKRVNVHIRPRNSQKEIIVSANEDQIKEQRENLVYHKAIAHVKAKQNLSTGKLGSYKLLELKAYKPRVSESELEEVINKGTKAWSSIRDAGEWVESLRGGDNA
ncbi:MAG: hypothetical protein AAGB46_06245 [Verrucomicrobiota bacterium]